MIVCSMFEGDDYDALQWQQHDAYGQALSIIVNEAKARLRRTETLVGLTALGDEVRLDQFDHHVLQDAHDLLAAMWRLENGHFQPPLPLSGLHVEAFVTQWLEWLKWKASVMADVSMRDVLMLGYMDPNPDHSAERRLLSMLRDELAGAARARGLRLTTSVGLDHQSL